MRFGFNKAVPEEPEVELDPVVADVLAAPVAGETRLLKALDDAPEELRVAAAVYARAAEALTEAYGGRLPEPVRKALDEVLGGKPEPPARPAPAPQRQPAAKGAAVGTEVRLEMLKAELERGDDWSAERDLERDAEAIRKASGYTLSRAQSVVAAVERHPELHERARRQQLRRAGYIDDRPAAVAKTLGAENVLFAAADRIRSRPGNEGMSREQAVAKALELNPDLYHRR